jgi:type VI secretion system protein ImpJ
VVPKLCLGKRRGCGCGPADRPVYRTHPVDPPSRGDPAMRTLAVHWHEGMFLRPHHFQAADRYWADQVRQSGRWDQPYNWGVRRIDLDPNALKAYRFVVRSLQARMRDGTIVRVPQDTALPELDLRTAFGAADTVEVLLAVPALDVNRANVVGPADEGSRFRIETPPGGVPDETTGQNNRQVQFRRLNLYLLLSGQDQAGYETLPLATLVRSTQGDQTPQLHKTVIPPLLACDAWPPMREEILQPVYYKVAQKLQLLGKIVRDGEWGLADADPDARAMVEKVRLLNHAAAVTRLLARTDGVHPLTAYTELSHLVGALSIFGATRTFPELEHDYNHDDLGGCLFELKRHLDHLLEMMGADDKYYSREFAGHGLQMRVEMDEPWLAPGWQLFVGVASNLASGEVIALLTSGQMNMKIASSDRVEEVFAAGRRGMVFRHQPQPPKVLPQTARDTYFSVEPTEDEWPFVQKTRRLAIRLNERLLDGGLEGKREVVIRGPTGRQPRLRFTLYVVPPKG